MQNSLSVSLTIADAKAQYDEHAKNILAEKQIFARIAKKVMKEAEPYSIEELMSFIQGEPMITKVPVNPGASNNTKLSQGNTESNIPDEGVYYFDIRADILFPENDAVLKVIVDLEAQKSFYPGYHFESRGNFYVSRLISAQSGVEFAGDDFDSIKKVYSIWICFNAPKKHSNSISRFEFKKTDIIPGFPDLPEYYDKMAIVIIALNEEKHTDDKFLKMLCDIFSTKKDSSFKKEALLENGITLDDKTIREVDIMCNLSGYVENAGMEKLSKLIKILMSENRNDEVKEVLDDASKRDALLKQYDIR